MFLPSWTLQIIVDNVFGHVLEHSGLTDRVRNKLGHEPVQQAFRDALGRALEYLGKEYPQREADLFDASFLETEGAPILAQFLVRDGHPDAGELAARWADSLDMHRPEQRVILVRELEPVAANFLDYLARELKKEPELSELNDSRVFEQLAGDLQALRYKLGAEQATSGTRRDYLRWLIERNLYLDPRGTFQTQRQVQVRLDEVYISLQAQREKVPGEVDRRVLEQEMAQLEAKITHTHHLTEEIEDQREHLAARLESHFLDLKNAPGEIIELAEAINQRERLVILGDPGSGKSTLLRYLALKHAQALYTGRSEAGSDLGSARFPLLIRIADYAEHGMPGGKSLSNYLADYFDMHECPRFGLADLLVTELSAGNCLILLDGLDEIVNADDRRKVVERIEDFIRHHDDRSNRFVITSRIAGYRSAPLGDPFTHYTVQEMNEAQIRRFLERWCPAVEAAQTPDLSAETRDTTARKEIDSIMKAVQSSPGVRRLAANPLLLRTLALIHRTGAQLPQRRIELYKLAADTLARTWRIAQGVPETALVDERYLTRLLGKLAYWLHENKPTGIATEREVYRELGQEWARIKGLDWEEDHPDIESEVKTFLRAVREHTGLFVERAPRRYGFMHLTFEEYYAARHLIARSKDRAKLIRKHLYNPRWEEPILLALGFVGLDSPEDAAELLETAIMAKGEDARESGFTPSNYEEQLGRDYLFALRCLGDSIPARPRVTDRLVRRLANELLHRAGSARFQRYRQSVNERLKYFKGSEASSILLPLLVAAMQDADPLVCTRAAESLGRLGQAAPEVVTTLVRALDDANQRLSNAAAWSLGQLSYSSAEVIDALLEILHGINPVKRHRAVVILGQSSQTSSEIETALLDALNDTGTDIRKAALQSMSLLNLASPKVVIGLREALHDADSAMRSQAVESLEQLGRNSTEARATLIEALHNANSEVRYQVALSLGRLDRVWPEVITSLIEALHDADPDVRYGAALSLSRLDEISTGLASTFIEALRKADLQLLREMAFDFQYGNISSQMIAILTEALHSDNPDVRRRAVRSLGKADHSASKVTSVLLEALHDEDASVRVEALESLGELGLALEEIVSALISTLHDKDPYIRRATVTSLGKLGQQEASDEVVRALLSALQDKVLDVRASAAESLGQIGQQRMSSAVVVSLFRALHDKNAEVRLAAAGSLGNLGYALQEVMDLERQALEDTAMTWSVRRSAAGFLGQFGQSDELTINTLWRGLLDLDHDLRSACVQALVQLGRRFPDSSQMIEKKFVQAIEDTELDKRDWNNRTARDHAYEGLWLLVPDSEFEKGSPYIS